MREERRLLTSDVYYKTIKDRTSALQWTENGAYYRNRVITKPVRYYNEQCRLQKR